MLKQNENSQYYFGVFIPGTEPIVESILRAKLPDIEIQRLSGGGVEFSTAVRPAEMGLYCLNNLFQVLRRSQAEPDPAGLERFMRRLPSSGADWRAAARLPKGYRTFRIVTSVRNQLTAVSKAAKAVLEQKLTAETRLRPDRSLPDCEFWVMVRGDGRAYFLKRLSRHRAYDKLLHKGELHPELCYMLCWLTSPGEGDAAADPFCGYGAIPAERCRRFPYKMVYASDLAEGPLALAREKLEGRAQVELGDALSLSQRLGEGSLDAVITDPPWGMYGDMGMELSELYSGMLAEFAKVLKPGGTAVVLTAAKQEMEQVLEETHGLELAERYDILVSGKKAAIFKLVKAG